MVALGEEDQQQEWITSSKAAWLLSQKTGRPINSRYIRRIAERGEVRYKVLANNMHLYNMQDVTAHTVSERVGKLRGPRVKKEADGA